ncbi:O-acetyl-ADP-ribose deacetylase [Maricurvus nonylphenolicus]|uniref:O-acetyl-ADP-ribose deacetylase n=1 Tax=Maricurvus nonylphenolicus TaxID=1008307 RepID=UPI0036F2CA45
MTQLTVVEGDITRLEVDVIVNAANSALAGGGGVDGAIHRAAGAEKLQAACRLLGGCSTGSAKATPAFALPAQAIFHAVGPIWRGGSQGEAELLASCYRQCIAMAEAERYQSIAFPAISCGVYGYPLDQAVVIAVDTVRSSLAFNTSLEQVIFCCFDGEMAERYHRVLNTAD